MSSQQVSQAIRLSCASTNHADQNTCIAPSSASLALLLQQLKNIRGSQQKCFVLYIITPFPKLAVAHMSTLVWNMFCSFLWVIDIWGEAQVWECCQICPNLKIYVLFLNHKGATHRLTLYTTGHMSKIYTSYI